MHGTYCQNGARHKKVKNCVGGVILCVEFEEIRFGKQETHVKFVAYKKKQEENKLSSETSAVSIILYSNYEYECNYMSPSWSVGW